VAASDEAVLLTPEGHSERVIRLSELSDSLQIRFQRTGNMADLDRAIEVAYHSVALTPRGHHERAQTLATLSISLLPKFQFLLNLDDLDRDFGV
jgi:hypothetical protein